MILVTSGSYLDMEPVHYMHQLYYCNVGVYYQFLIIVEGQKQFFVVGTNTMCAIACCVFCAPINSNIYNFYSSI